MKRIAMLFALLLSLGAVTAGAQTRVSVSVGFGAPRPYVSGYVILGQPYAYRHYRPYRYGYDRYDRYHRYDRRPEVIVVPRRPYHRRHQRGHRDW